MSEIGKNDIEIATGEVRTGLGTEATEVYQTGDVMGVLTHPDKEVREQLGDFFPRMLQGLLDLEEEVYAVSRRPVKLLNGDVLTPTYQSEAVCQGLQQLTTAVSRVLYYPVDEGDAIDPKENWFMKNYGKNFTAETSIIAYPARGYRPKYLAPSSYDFQEPAIVRLQIDDARNNQKLFIELFPTRYAQYPPKFAQLNGTVPRVATQALTELRVNPEAIKRMVDTAEASAVNPHLTLRLEGANGRPIGRVDGDLMVGKDGERTVAGFNLHMRSVGFEGQPQDRFVTRLENQGVFILLPSMQRNENVPLASFSKALIGVGLKKEFQVPAVSNPSSRR